MASRLIRVLCASILAMSVGAVYAADKEDIRLKKKTDGALELSNLAEEGEGEVLVENKGKTDGPAANPTTNIAPAATMVESEERGEVAERSETRGSRERPGSTPEEIAEGTPQRSAFGSGEVSGGAQVIGVGALTGGAEFSSSTSSGSNANAPSVLPNPRPATDQAVPSTVNTSSTGSQERYASKMLQEGAAASASGSLSVVDNPASVRRYLATDRATYQKRMGY